MPFVGGFHVSLGGGGGGGRILIYIYIYMYTYTYMFSLISPYSIDPSTIPYFREEDALLKQEPYT